MWQNKWENEERDEMKEREMKKERNEERDIGEKKRKTVWIQNVRSLGETSHKNYSFIKTFDSYKKRTSGKRETRKNTQVKNEIQGSKNNNKRKIKWKQREQEKQKKEEETEEGKKKKE